MAPPPSREQEEMSRRPAEASATQTELSRVISGLARPHFLRATLRSHLAIATLVGPLDGSVIVTHGEESLSR
jgi:hypothetical protein